MTISEGSEFLDYPAYPEISFQKKLHELLHAITSLREEAPVDIKRLVEASYDVVETGVNGKSEEVSQSLIAVIANHPDLNWTRMSLSVEPGTSKIISKSKVESAFGAFADQYKDNWASEYYLPNESRSFVEMVMKSSKEKGRGLSLSEQFSIALDLSHGNVLNATLIAHFGSRAVCRNMDTSISPLLTFSEEEMIGWRSAVADTKEINEEYGHPELVSDVGDSYHFWGGMLGGILVSTVNHPRDLLFNLGYAAIHYYGAEMTQLKDTITGNKSVHLHGPADKAGFKTGWNIARNLPAFTPEAFLSASSTE